MRKQQGMTLIGMILTTAVVVIIGIFIIRITPVYIQYYEILSSIDALNKLPSTEFTGEPASDAEMLRTKLLNQLYVNSVEFIKPEQIIISPIGPGQYRISTKYKVVQPLIANIHLLFDFSTSKEVKVSAQ